MKADREDGAGEPTFLQLLACSASLRLTCRDCSTICYPSIGKVALRVGLQSRFSDQVRVRCAHCSSQNTRVEVDYPPEFEPPSA